MEFPCTTLCYLENDKGEYLMLHRVKKKNDINHDKWIGVGGGCEAGESPDDCVVRETWEETGLTLTDYRLRALITFIYDDDPVNYMFLYTATGWTGTMVRECNEGDLAWIDKGKIYDLPIWKGDELFLRRIEDPNTPFFSLKLVYQGDTLVSAVLNGKELPL